MGQACSAHGEFTYLFEVYLTKLFSNSDYIASNERVISE
jgi:hypothetical protein